MATKQEKKDIYDALKSVTNRLLFVFPDAGNLVKHKLKEIYQLAYKKYSSLPGTHEERIKDMIEELKEPADARIDIIEYLKQNKRKIIEHLTQQCIDSEVPIEQMTEVVTEGFKYVHEIFVEFVGKEKMDKEKYDILLKATLKAMSLKEENFEDNQKEKDYEENF